MCGRFQDRLRFWMAVPLAGPRTMALDGIPWLRLGLGGFPIPPPAASVTGVARLRMTQLHASQLHDLRLRLLVQQEGERIADSQPDQLDLSVVQARTLCWLALLAEAHEEQATDAERRGDVEQAMGWFADAMRLRDVIHVVSSIEIPLPAACDGSDPEEDGSGDHHGRGGGPLLA